MKKMPALMGARANGRNGFEQAQLHLGTYVIVAHKPALNPNHGQSGL